MTFAAPVDNVVAARYGVAVSWNRYLAQPPDIQLCSSTPTLPINIVLETSTPSPASP